MNNYEIRYNTIWPIKNGLDQNIGGFKDLTERERNIVRIAIKRYFSKSSATIPSEIAQKLNLAEKPHTVSEANRTMWKMLEIVKAIEGTGEIIIAGQVLSDGKGDWAAMRNMYKTLKKKFPDRPIRIIVSSAERWRGGLDTSNISHLDMIYYKNAENYGEKVPLEAFPKDTEILKKALEASVIISAGVSINTVFESIHGELKDKSIKVKENDFRTGSYGEELGKTFIQAGLNPLNDDRMGIFTNSYKRDHTWKDVANVKLLSALFGFENPSEDEINSYLSSHECFFGYTNGEEAQQMFMQDALAFAAAHSPDKMVDFCIPGICKDNAAKMNDKFFENLNIRGLNVGKVHLVWFDGDEKKERTINLGNSEREIRIIDPGTISNRDFKIMTNISAPIVACTGDNSLALALSYGKIPCYEARFEQKYEGLLYKIGEVQGRDSVLYKYCIGLKKYEDIVLRRDLSIARADGLAAEAKLFGEYIRNEANLKPVLNGAVNEKLLRQKDPDFAEQQDQLMQKYLNNSITHAELRNQFTALLKEKKLL